MPTYDYECLKCKKTFEAFQKMSDEPLKQCPDCQGQVKRLIGSGSGLIFKGKGFYSTDYKKPATKPKKEAKAECTGCKNSACPQQDKK